MKISFALSTILLLLPSLVTALRESDGRSLKDLNYLPRRSRSVRRSKNLLNRNTPEQDAELQRQLQQVQADRQKNQEQDQLNQQKAQQQQQQAQQQRQQQQQQQQAAQQAAQRQQQQAQNKQNNNNNNNGNQNANQNNNQNANANQNNTQNANQNANANQNNATANQNNTQNANQNANANQNNATATQNNNQNNQNNNNNNDNDPQKSLTLLAELVATGLAQDGQADVTEDGQVRSLTSTNNFINFCIGKTITNGEQVAGGSCNPVPMGDIIPQAKMPSAKFKFPKNFSTIPANQAFTAELAVQNMDTGTFTNAQKTYYAAPQQLNSQGILIAHSHIVIQAMGDFASPDILDPIEFAFFKGLNDPAVNGVLSAVVDKGLAPGNYRMASINTNGNHAPAVGAVAQHGFFDDIVYFTAK